MRILKAFYIIWVIFSALGCIFSGALAYDYSQARGNFYPSNEILKLMLVFLMFCLYPLLPYSYYLIYKKAIKSKNIFSYVFLYFLTFSYTFLYFLIIIYQYEISIGDYLILATLPVIVCIIILLYKFEKKLSLYFYIFLHIVAYLYIFSYIFMVGYELKWNEILFDKDVRIYIYKEIYKEISNVFKQQPICFKNNRSISCKELNWTTNEN